MSSSTSLMVTSSRNQQMDDLNHGARHRYDESSLKMFQVSAATPFFKEPETATWNPLQNGIPRREFSEAPPRTDFPVNSSTGFFSPPPLPLPRERAPSVSHPHRHSIDSGVPFSGFGTHPNHYHDFQELPNRSGAMTARAAPHHHRSSLVDCEASDMFAFPSCPFPPLNCSHDSMLPSYPGDNSSSPHLPNGEFGLSHGSHGIPPIEWQSLANSQSFNSPNNNNCSSMNDSVNSNNGQWHNANRSENYPSSPPSYAANSNSDDQDSPLSSRHQRDQRLPNFLSFPEKPCSQDAVSPMTDRFAWSSSEHNSPLSVFVGNVPKNTSPEAFNRLMSLKGTVIEVVCDFRPDCWLTAFVTYSKPSEAAKAVEFFNNRRAIKTAPPHRLVCCFAPHPPASLCCSPTPTCRPQELKAGSVPVLPFFPKFGPDRSDHVSTLRRTSPILRFSLLKDGPPGANLFIYGIPSDWTEVTLMRLCQEFGHIVGIRVPSAPVCPASGPQRLNKGFGFVSYDCTDSSARALEALSGRQFLGKPLNIQLKLGEQLAGYCPPINPSNPSSQMPAPSNQDGSSSQRSQHNSPYWSQQQQPPPLSLPHTNRFAPGMMPIAPTTNLFLNFPPTNHQPNPSSPIMLSSSPSNAYVNNTPRNSGQLDAVNVPNPYPLKMVSPVPSGYVQEAELNASGPLPWNHVLSPGRMPPHNGDQPIQLPPQSLSNHTKCNHSDIRRDPWTAPSLSCRPLVDCSNMSTADDSTPTTTAASTPDQNRTTCSRPSSGESTLSSSMLPDHPDFTSTLSSMQPHSLHPNSSPSSMMNKNAALSTTKQQASQSQSQSQSSLLNFMDSPHLLTSVLGLLSSQYDSHSTVDSSTSVDDSHLDPFVPFQNIDFSSDAATNPELFAENDVGLWKLLEQHWSQTGSSGGEMPSLLDLLSTHHAEGCGDGSGATGELKIRDAASSHEDLKALFNSWRKNSLTRSGNNQNNSQQDGKPSRPLSYFSAPPPSSNATTFTSSSNDPNLWRLPFSTTSSINDYHHPISPTTSLTYFGSAAAQPN